MVISKKYIDKARRMASRSTCKNYRAGAVIAKGSFLLGHGRNRPFTPFERVENLLSQHAETDAVGKARGDLEGAVVYVCVLNQKDNDVCSRPCESCIVSLRHSGISTMVYSDRGEIKIEKL